MLHASKRNLILPDLRFEKIFSTSVYEVGRIYVEGIYICDYLVPTAKAVPKGKYRYTLYSSPKHGIVPLLVNVPGRSMIEVHAGNTVKDSEGCFLAGYNQHIGTVSNSRVAVNVLRRNVVPSDYSVLTGVEYNGLFEYV